MADDAAVEDYPTEIEDNLNDFDSSLSSVQNMVQTLVSVSRSDRLLKLDPLEQAKLDLMSAYALNSMFWMYLVTQGVNPKDHPIKQELERIRTYMNKVKEITDRRKAAHIDKEAASRFVRNALWDADDKKRKDKTEHQQKGKHTKFTWS
ncbi:nuclear nucleic acid-binding protein C1D [Danio rerio]|uniref:Nuclear nucleic acid-binding protein C1D n=1 Tax=Danio rerio TaxID=7955 RepID=C1D_DANRE|nr:nuclear nucleic acid-binding protein C1D [Danio rerio]Q5XJ97.1 RecName: Full=Nuclear nucleic acid-binding protein C1D [Danio rerio]AAH83407.1 C1D nuclear receptor co-repressor [Danio rerio]|eukprot:NP_001007060.1 nuclear nucleic acid-binding protein C1D [Danio rerio]